VLNILLATVWWNRFSTSFFVNIIEMAVLWLKQGLETEGDTVGLYSG
jgi:hypothetical protein